MPKIPKPKAVENPDFSRTKKICQQYIDFVASKDYHEDNDFKDYIFETALEDVFGADVWKFINSK